MAVLWFRLPVGEPSLIRFGLPCGDIFASMIFLPEWSRSHGECRLLAGQQPASRFFRWAASWRPMHFCLLCNVLVKLPRDVCCVFHWRGFHTKSRLKYERVNGTHKEFRVSIVKVQRTPYCVPIHCYPEVNRLTSRMPLQSSKVNGAPVFEAIHRNHPSSLRSSASQSNLVSSDHHRYQSYGIQIPEPPNKRQDPKARVMTA